MAEGVLQVVPAAELDLCPMGDGGEGTLDALLGAVGGVIREVPVSGPLGELRRARLGLLRDGQTAYVEMAEASGLSCVAPAGRNPRITSSRGTGELLNAAFDSGRPRVVIGLGGSATNDGGAGMLGALGARLAGADGKSLEPGGEALGQLKRIEMLSLRRPPPGVELIVASDVTNPLCGREGASAIYGPQKGASAEDVAVLDAALARFAAVAAETLGQDDKNTPGAGAAGGLGFALLAFLGARIERGAELVARTAGLERRLEGADLVLTGEGRIDGQTFAYGKTLAVVGCCARATGVPCIGFAGAVTVDPPAGCGVNAALPVISRPMSDEEAMGNAAALIAAGVARGLRLYVLGSKGRTGSAREGVISG